MIAAKLSNLLVWVIIYVAPNFKFQIKKFKQASTNNQL